MLEIQRSLVGVVEAAYRLETRRNAWLQGLADALGQLNRLGPGLMVYLYDASRPERGVQISDWALNGLGEDFARATVELNANTPPDEARQVYHRGITCATVSEILAVQGLLPSEHPLISVVGKKLGLDDCWGLSASNPNGRGVGVASPLPEVTSMPEATRELWELVGVHLVTAFRLRSAIEEEASAAAAILKPDGTVLHAEGDAKSLAAREALQAATQRIDRARSQSVRQNSEVALSLWHALVQGRWSLVEREDADGKRFFVARRNEPRFDEPKVLTHRERQVVAFASQGDSVARISYALGFSEATIDALLQSSLDKLELDSPERLVELRLLFEGG